MSKSTFRRRTIRSRIRRKISGSKERPRLAVFRSNNEIYVQLIDDTAGHTLTSTSSKTLGDKKATKSEKAKEVGLTIAKQAQDLGITSVVFDRGGYLYHGRVKVLAEAAREGGLKF